MVYDGEYGVPQVGSSEWMDMICSLLVSQGGKGIKWLPFRVGGYARIGRCVWLG